MKRVLLISLMAFLCLGLSAQEKTIKKSKEYKKQWSKEDYHVLKRDKSIKHGLYTLSRLDGVLKAKGLYEQGEKTGVWTYFTYEGEIEQQYDFSNKKLIYHNEDSEKTNKHFRLYAGQYIEFTPDRPAIFIGGNATKFFSTSSRLEYPLNARRMGIQGTVLIEVVVTADGRLIQEKVIQKIGGGCDEEALRMVKLIPDTWVPALYKGQPVTSKFEMPVVFKLK